MRPKGYEKVLVPKSKKNFRTKASFKVRIWTRGRKQGRRTTSWRYVTTQGRFSSGSLRKSCPDRPWGHNLEPETLSPARIKRKPIKFQTGIAGSTDLPHSWRIFVQPKLSSLRRCKKGVDLSSLLIEPLSEGQINRIE